MNALGAFNPDLFIPAAPTAPPMPPHRPADVRAVPKLWAHGLDLLAERPFPAGAERGRWEQIVADTHRLTTTWLDMAVGSGWSIENLFGFSHDEPRGEYGLAIAIRGGKLIRIDADMAAIQTADGWRWHHPRILPGTSLLWNFKNEKPSR